MMTGQLLVVLVFSESVFSKFVCYVHLVLLFVLLACLKKLCIFVSFITSSNFHEVQ